MARVCGPMTVGRRTQQSKWYYYIITVHFGYSGHLGPTSGGHSIQIGTIRSMRVSAFPSIWPSGYARKKRKCWCQLSTGAYGGKAIFRPSHVIGAMHQKLIPLFDFWRPKLNFFLLKPIFHWKWGSRWLPTDSCWGFCVR